MKFFHAIFPLSVALLLGTIAAMREAEDMKKHPEKYKGYHDVDEMMKDLLA